MHLLINNLLMESCYLALVDNSRLISQKKYPLKKGEGEKLLFCVKDFLRRQRVQPRQLAGLIINKGPGSFTSVRQAVLLANAWAYALKIPIFGFTGRDFDNIQALINKLKTKRKTRQIQPVYGAEPKITKPKQKP